MTISSRAPVRGAATIPGDSPPTSIASNSAPKSMLRPPALLPLRLPVRGAAAAAPGVVPAAAARAPAVGAATAAAEGVGRAAAGGDGVGAGPFPETREDPEEDATDPAAALLPLRADASARGRADPRAADTGGAGGEGGPAIGENDCAAGTK